MNSPKTLVCPLCHGGRFVVKYEVSHVYSYVVDSDAPGRRNNEEYLSFLYDELELTRSDQYLECRTCGAKFPCSFNVWNTDASLKELQDVINQTDSLNNQ